MKYTILFLALVSLACAQSIPKTLSWEHDYQTIAGTPIDKNLVEFNVYNSFNNVDFVKLSTVSDTSYYLLQNEFLYSNDSVWFYCTAVRTDLNTESAPSDTVGDYFPVLEPDKPYLLKVIKMK